MNDSENGINFPTLSAASHKVTSQAYDAPILEGYRIVEELPRGGGQALVYKAIHNATKAKVALKVLPSNLHTSSTARRNFEREIELAASLNHPNIVTIRDSGLTQGQYYFAMEYIHGMPLAQHIKSQDLSFRDKMQLFRKICDAITHAHQRGVIHRDLKPSNIMIDEREEPHILDFGLAKSGGQLGVTSEATHLRTITGEIKGTVAYMSPEQALGRSDLIDIRTDVYSLGVILYEMLLGQFPYDVSGSALETLQNVKSADPLRPRQIANRFNSDVEAIILKCLEKDPHRRYQSAAGLRDEIGRWLEGLPLEARSISSLYLMRKLIERHRYTMSVVLLLILLVLGFISSLVLHRRERIAQNARHAAGNAMYEQAIMFGKNFPQLTFIQFLEAWHRNDSVQISRMKDSQFDRNRKEYRGMICLLSLDADIGESRRMLEGAAPWFMELVIGEKQLKAKDYASALQSYRRGVVQLEPHMQPVSGDGMLKSLLVHRFQNLVDTGDTAHAGMKP